MPTTNVLSFEEVPISQSPSEFADQLKVGDVSALLYVQRLRLADEVPVILETRFVVKSACPEMSLADLNGSLYDAWTGWHRLEIGGADVCIRAVLPSRGEAAHLAIPSGSPLFEVRSTGFLSSGQPLWWERTLYRGDSYEFHSHLSASPKATPVRGALRQN